MKSKKRLKRDLRILKKKKLDICSEMELSYEVIKQRLKECYKMEMNFRCAVEKAKVRKRFKRRVAGELGVKYSVIKNHFPSMLNSTLISNCLESVLANWSRPEIRNICQKVKLEFEFGDYL